MQERDFVTALPLRCGVTLPQARLVYGVWGRLNDAGDNLVLYPTRFGGIHRDNGFMIGPDRALDPARWCIVVPNMLGNGVSSSPNNTGAPFAGADFPAIDHADNVDIQRRMLAAHFGGAAIALAFGWSMGAQQAYRWAVEEPARVARLCTFCGTARTTPHNRVFLESLLAALEADPRHGGAEPPLGGLRAVGRIYAGWAYSQPWLKARMFRELGFADLDDWLLRYWDALYAQRDAGVVSSLARTWIANDVAAGVVEGGDLAAALSRITARTLVMAARTDLYFTPEDCAAEAAMIPGAIYREVDTIWGHMAGSPQSAADTRTVDAALRDLLAA